MVQFCSGKAIAFMTRTLVKISAGPNESATLELTSPEFSIGFDYENEIVLDDHTVKSKHLIISNSDDNSLEILQAFGEYDIQAKLHPETPNRYLLPATVHLGESILEIFNPEEETKPAFPSVGDFSVNDTISVLKTQSTKVGDAFSSTSDIITNRAFYTSMGFLGTISAIAALFFGVLYLISIVPVQNHQTSPVPQETLRNETAPRFLSIDETQSADIALMAAKDFKAELERRNINGLGIEPFGSEMLVWGILPDTMKPKWSTAIEWYEGQYGLTWPLKSEVEFASESALVQEIAIISPTDPIGIYTKRGTLVERGDILIDDWQIVDINRQSVKLRKDGRDLTLTLPQGPE